MAAKQGSNFDDYMRELDLDLTENYQQGNESSRKLSSARFNNRTMNRSTDKVPCGSSQETELGNLKQNSELMLNELRDYEQKKKMRAIQSKTGISG